MTTKKTGLELLREPFPAHLISKLPKSTGAQSAELQRDKNLGIKCQLCGGWHHRNAIHLDYVGHAALTDRLLDCDQSWYWEPLSFDNGLPKFDATGGLWIKLTVCGITRLGYGHAEQSNFKEIGSREKEVIGDALRNAAMRFGAALDLWHKGELHIEEQKKEIVTERSLLTPKQTIAWEHAKLAYMRDGNLDKVLERRNISVAHIEQLKMECEQ